MVEVLKTEELGEVKKYLESTFFNTNRRCVQLYEQLCKFHPNMEGDKLTKERLYAKVFGKVPYDDGKMRKLMTQLSQLIERYLVIKQLDKSEDVTAKLLIKSLGDRNDYELFKTAAEGRINFLEKQPLRGKDYYRETHLLNEMLYYHPETEKLTKGNDYLRRAVQSFEQYFTLLSLQNAADIMVRNRLVGTEIPIQYLEAINTVAIEAGFTGEVTIKFSYQLLQLYLGLEAVDLEALKSLAFLAFGKMSKYEQSFAISSLRNYATPKLNVGSLPHAKFVFELFKFEIQNELLILGQNYLNSATYMNIVTTGLLVNEIEWVRQFIKDYSLLLSPDERDVATNICSGFWHYSNGILNDDLGEFYTSLQSYNLVPTRIGVKYELRVRPAILRSHFEIFKRGKEPIDELLQHVRNFERHIIANDFYAEPTKKQYLIFLKYFKKLSKLYVNPNLKPAIVNQYLILLESEQSIIFKRWLKENGKELLNQSKPLAI